MLSDGEFYWSLSEFYCHVAILITLHICLQPSLIMTLPFHETLFAICVGSPIMARWLPSEGKITLPTTTTAIKKETKHIIRSPFLIIRWFEVVSLPVFAWILNPNSESHPSWISVLCGRTQRMMMKWQKNHFQGCLLNLVFLKQSYTKHEKRSTWKWSDYSHFSL